MDKLTVPTHLGGWPLEINDLENLQSDVRTALYGILSAFGITAADSFILSGCGSTLNGANYDIDPGYLVLEGEVYQVSAHSINTTLAGSEQHMWAVVTTDDYSALDRDGNSFYKRQLRRAEVVKAVPSGGYLPMVAETIHDRIARNSTEADHLTPTWTSLTPNYFSLTTNSGTGYLKYRRQPSGLVEVAGRMTGDGESHGTGLATLPAGYRPSVHVPFPVHVEDTAQTADVRWYINTDGKIIDESGGPSTTEDFIFYVAFIPA